MRKAMGWILSLFLLSVTGVCLAQSVNSGDIRGTVTDPTGAVIPGASVTVDNVNTGVVKTYTTDGSGVYDTGAIVNGSYKVTFTHTGFTTLVRGPITVIVGTTTLNAVLKVGSVATKVVVTTNVPLLQTSDGTQQTTLNAKNMQKIPQVAGGDGASWENFMILLPGTTGVPGSPEGSSNPGQTVSVNGNLPYSNILADGASTTLSHSQNANPAIFDTVAELQVSTSDFSAQYGTGGMIINQISKGGTNHFHGSLYDYFQNNDLNASGYRFGGTRSVPVLHFNDFGGNVGGPILRNKMFFFFDYDQVVQHGSASNSFNTIPSAAVMDGNFTAPGSFTIYDPTTQVIQYDSHGNPYPVRQSFESEYGSNAIPANMIDPVAKKFEQWYPTPSNHIAGGHFVAGSPGTEGVISNNFYSSLPQSTPYRKYFGRLDYQISTNNRLSMSDTQSDTPVVYPNSVTAYPIGWQSGDVDNNNAQVTDVWNISPMTINEARMGFTWQGNFFNDLALGKGYAAQLGWKFAKADDFPAIQFYRNYPYAWIQPSANAVYKEQVFDPSDVVTMIRGKHVLHFGGEMLIYRDDSTAWGNTNAGTMGFSGAYTEEWDHAACGSKAAYADQMCPDPSTGMEYADFLLGLAGNWSAGVSPEYGARFKSPQVFVQDDYKVTPNLTLNLGLRYQINIGWKDVKGNVSSFDPNLINPATNTPGAYWYGTTKAGGRSQLYHNVYGNVMPRVGFSWLVRPNTTIRGGGGLYSYNWSLDNYGGSFGSVLSSSGNISDQTNGITPIVELGGNGDVYGTSNPLPYSQASTSPTRFNGQNVNYYEYHLPVPKIWQYNLQVQQELGTNIVAELAYVGSHGYNLAFPTDLNQIPEDKLAPNDSGDRPYSNYLSIQGSTNNAISNYNSLQAEIQKRMTNNFSFDFSYVWSHFLDDQDSSNWGSREGQQNYQIANDPSANYSNSNFDVRNAFKGFVTYELPFGKGMRWLNHNGYLNEAVGGWQIASSMVFMSGQPYTLFTSQNTYALAGSSFPNWNPGVNPRPNHRSARCQTGTGCPNEWYNPAAFLEPAPGTFGNVRRNSLYGPGINYVNLSAGKVFFLPWEGMQFELRADATNAFNHASFSPPSVTTLSGSAGPGQPFAYNGQQQIDGTQMGGRTVQLTGRFTF